MPYPIEDKLVVAVASSALFDLKESDQVFREKGEEAYRKYQRINQNSTLRPGAAFPFIRRLLELNATFPEQQPVEVVFLSRNDPDTGLRVLKSIGDHGLNISRGGFLSGKSPFEYIPAFNVSLFLSANEEDVRQAVDAGHPAGTVLQAGSSDDSCDSELRVAFDFDGVLADDESEQVYQESRDMERFHSEEEAKAAIPHGGGPLKDLFTKLGALQKLELKRAADDPDYKRHVRVAIVSARNGPSHERVVTSLREWDVMPDETFFLGGIEKRRILNVLKPHIYFDDQFTHLASAAGSIPSVHIPFGKLNRPADDM